MTYVKVDWKGKAVEEAKLARLVADREAKQIRYDIATKQSFPTGCLIITS
jgi:hypothetical protein